MINDDCAFSLQKLFFINRTAPIDDMVGSRVLYLGHSNFVITLFYYCSYHENMFSDILIAFTGSGTCTPMQDVLLVCNTLTMGNS